jgi:NADPH-dependent glutamate synthase beta subunit-like oxidoreductase
MLEVDRYSLETSRKNFYAGGDLITGASNVSNAMGYGKKAARNIDQRLMAEKRWKQIYPEFEYAQSPPAHPSESGRHHVREVDAAVRAKTFNDATVGLTPVEAMEETCRCLRCDVRNDG